MTKQDFCKKFGITEDQFYGKEKIEGSLDLSSITSIPEGFNPTVGWSLYLNSVTSIPEGFNPTVGESLFLNRVTSIPDGFNPTVGESLVLNSVTSIPEGFNPTVGHSLYLESVTSIPEGFNPTVGLSLHLESVTSIPEGFNPTIGESLFLKEGISNQKTSLPEDYVFTWQDGKYIKCDGILTEVISKKGNVYRVKKLEDTVVSYLVTDGHGKWSHGETLKEARDDLIFKIGDVDKSKFENLQLSDSLSFAECIECYRVVTGACSFGVKNFLARKIKRRKKSYKISEIVDLTEGEYGSDIFMEFFKLKEI